MMATKVMSQQDSFLNQARTENIMVTIHLINGFQLKGFVKGFDNFTVVLESMGRQQLIYKHAISTISPGKPFSRKKFDEQQEAQPEEATTEATENKEDKRLWDFRRLRRNKSPEASDGIERGLRFGVGGGCGARARADCTRADGAQSLYA